ncbi:MAG: SMC-Scp complex subunit ScpB [Bacteroidia bacterium]|nr:SMC-Scp complex subunit ScpB [Bacteroidia bacterium]MDW8134532.1 SMC-Scp complex subunit ScpB [Bacteroidia bacterium]
MIEGASEVQGNNYPLENIIESFLFVNSEPISSSTLQKALECVLHRTVSPEEMSAALQELKRRYAPTSLELLEIGGGYALRTRPAYGELVAEFLGFRNPIKLSKPLLETLAVIAYHQPITRAMINHLRGVQSDYAVERLLELELIEPAGRASLPGKPLAYRTTRRFLELLGVNSLEELPQPEDFVNTASLPKPPNIYPSE